MMRLHALRGARLAALWVLWLVPGCGEEVVVLDPAGDDDVTGDDDTTGDDDATGDDDTTEDDVDGDGYTVADGDCDDADATVHPGAAEQCDDVDHDCDGEVHDDDDGDGHDICDDCDDAAAGIHPGATELCNGLDDDCDGTVSGEEDADADAFRLCHGDCDDSDPTINPGVDDTPYDGVDNDCDGADLLDADGDGYEWDGIGGEDCDDAEATTFPGAHESPGDSVDSNCDGLDDPVLGENCYLDSSTIAIPGVTEGASLSYGDASDGPAGSGFLFDDVEFLGSAGTQVNIDLRDDDYWMDPYLFVLDPYCQVIAEDDNSGGDEDDAYLLLDLPADGIYTIIATSADSWQFGNYIIETW